MVRLQIELVNLQEWVKHTGYRVAVVFDGRDAVGKGGTIELVTEAMPPGFVRPTMGDQTLVPKVHLEFLQSCIPGH